MKKTVLVLGIVLFAQLSPALGLDLPFDLNFNIGFALDVVPDAEDVSLSHGLVVTPERIMGDKKNFLTIVGTITNCSDIRRDNLEMIFAVSSHVGIGKSFARAIVEPASMPPGGTANFRAFVILDDEYPKRAAYTLTFRP